MIKIWNSAVAALLLAVSSNYYTVKAEDGAYYAADDGGNGDDGNGDDGANRYYQDDDDKMDNYSGGNDFIKYWTEYAVLPKKCITMNNKDMIVYSMYEKYYNHCSDKSLGTYMIDVPTFVSAYAEQLDLNAQDMYGDDYAAPDTTYVNCYPHTTDSGAVYYVQMGCTDGSTQSLSVNVYKDNVCSKPDKSYGFDDSNIDVSHLQVPFKQCTSCVNFVDSNLDDVDDKYFEQRFKNAPLCETVWEYKSKCGMACKRKGNEGLKGWNSSDKLLLSVLGIFSSIMFAVIMKKRTKMSKKDALLEEAAMSAAGLEQTHVLGIFAITLFVILLCGLAGFKGLTWTLLLIVNVIFFAYLMKLTIDSGLNVPLGPDGEPLGDEDSSDDEDDDDDEDDEQAPYKPPSTPEASPSGNSPAKDTEAAAAEVLPPIV
jgi:hypothetical protein